MPARSSVFRTVLQVSRGVIKIADRALAWAVRVNPRVIRIQDMRRKWGSCSSSGTVTLAADIVDHDVRFQDFVIAHELLHLRVPTHGRLFKALMSAHVAGWRQIERHRATSPTDRGIEQ